MEKIKKNFGFGCMRLPMNGSDVDIPETKRMSSAPSDQKAAGRRGRGI